MPAKPWDNTVKYTVIVFLLILLGAGLWYFREIYQPLVTAALIAYLFNPMINLLVQRTVLKRKTAARLVYFFMLATLVILLVAVIPALIRQSRDTLHDLNLALDNYEKIFAQPVSVGGVSLYLEQFIPAIRGTMATALAPRPDLALQILMSTSRGFLWFLVIVVTTYHLMTEWDKLREWLIGLAPDSYQPDIRQLYMQIRAVWLGYLGGQMRLVAVLMIIYSAAWFAIGLPGAIQLGILAGLFNLVPEVGPGATALIAMLVALLEGSHFLPISNGWFALLTGGVYLVLNNFKSIYLQPRILGKSVSLHEGVVFVAIIAALILQGILGVLVVVPLLSSLMIILRYTRRKMLGLNPFDEPVAEKAGPAPAAAEKG